MAITATPTAAESAITPAELSTKLRTNDGPLLLDVRTPVEFESVHVSGSINLPLDLLQRHRVAFADQLSGEIALICQAGTRSAQAHKDLRTAGVDTARVVDGGVAAMETQHADLTVRGRQRWAMDRQVRMVAGSLVLGGFVGGKLISPKATYLAGAIGAGLTFSALTDSCAMAAALNKMPWNKTESVPTFEAVSKEISRSSPVATRHS